MQATPPLNPAHHPHPEYPQFDFAELFEELKAIPSVNQTTKTFRLVMQSHFKTVRAEGNRLAQEWLADYLPRLVRHPNDANPAHDLVVSCHDLGMVKSDEGRFLCTILFLLPKDKFDQLRSNQIGPPSPAECVANGWPLLEIAIPTVLMGQDGNLFGEGREKNNSEEGVA